MIQSKSNISWGISWLLTRTVAVATVVLVAAQEALDMTQRSPSGNWPASPPTSKCFSSMTRSQDRLSALGPWDNGWDVTIEQLNRTQNTTCHATSMASMAMAHLLWPHLKTFWVNQGAMKNLRPRYPRCWVCVAGSRMNVLKYFGFPLSWYCLSSDADFRTWNPWQDV